MLNVGKTLTKKTEFGIFSDIDFKEPTILNMLEHKQRRSIIIATLNDIRVGPVDLQNMMEAGMNVARLKPSHMTKGEKMRMLGMVDKAALNCCKKYGVKDWPVATCMELKTCVVKTGLLEEEAGFIPIKEGSSVLLTYNLSTFDSCTAEQIFVDNPKLTSEAKIGTEISIGQGELFLHCTEILNDKTIKCVVTQGGNLANLAIVSMRGVKRQRPVLSKIDFHNVKFAVEYQVDMIIVNYPREAETLKKIKQFIGKKLKRPLLVAGICSEEDLENIDAIAKESDAVLLSRDYLYYELDSSYKYKLSHIQKWVGAKCQKYGKPYFICGGIFREFLRRGDCIDREISDVVNALLDGANGFILKDCFKVETLVDVIKYLCGLCSSTEPYTNSRSGFWWLVDEAKAPRNAAEAAMSSCVAVANQCQAKVIVLPTVTGCTAKALCRMRPACLVLTVSANSSVTRMLSAYRCCIPLIYTGPTFKKWAETVKARVDFAIEYAVKRGWCTFGDNYATLQRGAEESSFCDTVCQWPVAIFKRTLVECPEDDENMSMASNKLLD